MRLTWRDGAATLLVAAIAVPYIGYVINGSMPFIQDPTGMAGLGLLLGAAAAVIGGWVILHEGTFLRVTTEALALVSFGLGITALLSEHLMDLTARQFVLGAFMLSIAAMWGLALLHYGGVVRGEVETPSGLRHGHA
jgi:hypothetical protein